MRPWYADLEVDGDSLDILGHPWRRRAPGRLAGAFGESWYQGRTIFGGLVAAVLARAAEDAVDDPDRMPRSLTVQFTAPVVHGDAVASVEVARAGKYVTQVAGRLEQDGRVVAMVLGSFGAGREHALRFHDAPMPRVPPFESLTPMPSVPVAPAFTQHVEFRYGIGGLPFSGAPAPELGGWCRLRPPAPPDLTTMCALLDAWPPPALSMMREPTPGATIDLTYHFTSPLPLPGVADETPYLFRYRSPTIADGYAEQLGELWLPDGTLVGRVRELAAVF